MSSAITFVAPRLNHCVFNEAEMLGSIVWLWMQSDFHNTIQLKDLPALLLPAIKSRQFIVAIKEEKPVFYLSWANLSAEAESRYINHVATDMPLEDWDSGDRMWVLDIVAPFGNIKTIISLLLSDGLLSSKCWRTLYHKGDKTGLIIKEFKGRHLSRTAVRNWFSQRPIQNLPEKARLLPI